MYKKSSSLQHQSKGNKRKRIGIFLLRTAIALGCTCVFYFFLHTLVDRTNPVLNKIKDLQLSDLAFAYGRGTVPQDTDIVLINCTVDSRAEIAEKLRVAAAAKPKVIGVDIVFSQEYADGDTSLRKVLEENRDIVVLARDIGGKQKVDTAIYNGNFHVGYIYSQDDLLATKRYYLPYYEKYTGIRHHDGELWALPTAMWHRWSYLSNNKKIPDSLKFKEKLIINYKKSQQRSRYKVYYDTDSITKDSIFLQDKFVIMGGWDTTSMIDKHYTPLNGHLGRSWPDMNGTEYHAQVLSMLYKGERISEPHCSIRFILISILSMIWILFLDKVHYSKKLAPLDHLVAELTICIFTILALVVSVVCLNQNIKIEPVAYIVPVYITGLFRNVFKYFYKAQNH
jgi:CHASE2 domain-containing sensor protein